MTLVLPDEITNSCFILNNPSTWESRKFLVKQSPASPSLACIMKIRLDPYSFLSTVIPITSHSALKIVSIDSI